MLKGMGVNKVVAVLLAVMIGGVVSVTLTSEGALGETLNTGFDRISNYTATNSIVIEDNEVSGSAKKTFSDAVHYVYHRAKDGGCAKDSPPQSLDNQGYKGLTGTSLTQFPDCIGAEETAARGLDDFNAKSDGNDAEGLPSRVSFTIKDNFTLSWKKQEVSLTEEPDDDSFDEQLGGARDGGYKELTRRGENLDGDFFNDWVIFFRFEDNRARSSKFLKYIGRLAKEKKVTYSQAIEDLDAEEAVVDLVDLEVRLCEGDEGYIQMNKGYPSNTGEVGAGEETFKHIVVESKGTDCGNLGKVPEEHTLGNTLSITMDAGVEYPEGASPPDPLVNPIELRNFSKEYELSGDFDPDVDSDKCGLLVTDTDGSGPIASIDPWQHGLYRYEPGKRINKTGKISKASSKGIDMQEDGEDKGANDVYSNLRNKGFNGEGTTNLGVVSPLQRFRLHGDLLCLDDGIDEVDEASWAVCDFNLDKELRKLKWNGNSYTCNPKTGDWIKESDSSE